MKCLWESYTYRWYHYFINFTLSKAIGSSEYYTNSNCLKNVPKSWILRMRLFNLLWYEYHKLEDIKNVKSAKNIFFKNIFFFQFLGGHWSLKIFPK